MWNVWDVWLYVSLWLLEELALCGIAGSVSLIGSEGQVSPREVDLMTAAMERRGPDGQGLWQSTTGNAILGHRRLAIIDLTESGRQPMSSASGRFIITFNGEIYNYQTLRARLEQEGVVFRSTSDTEVLLALYERYGTAMFEQLRGMYAFAIYDTHSNSLLLVRDPYGIKPLYVSSVNGIVRFCSQVRPLRRVLGKLTVSVAGVVGFLLYGSVPEPYTMFEEIRSVPAGHYMVLREGQLSAPVLYCSVSKVLASVHEGAGRVVNQPCDRYTEVFRETIECHMVADVDTHVFLSAGKDSTAIAALASKMRRDVKSLTVGFPEFVGTPMDERPVSSEVAKRLCLDHREVTLSLHDRKTLVGEFLRAMDQPTIDGLNTFYVSHALHQSGGKVALSGLGGDELLMGYSTFRSIPALVRFCGSHLVRRWLGGDRVRRLLTKQLSSKAASVFALGGTMSGAYLLKRGVFMPWELSHVMRADAAALGLERLGWFESLERLTSGIGDKRLQVAALESQMYMRNQLLRDADWAGMHWSVEVRTPLVDFQLLKKITEGRTKGLGWPGKNALLGGAFNTLPRSVHVRRKTGFSIPEFDPCGSAEGRRTGYREWSLRVLRHYLQSEGVPNCEALRACAS
ncbi:MAG: asparagine synthase (glutamine-hydrolyzing) [Bryobacterales bacterium]|nr:asparagine synthase (glutamine-hydrolyzing) [Bryobacterales bacterium]